MELDSDPNRPFQPDAVGAVITLFDGRNGIAAIHRPSTCHLLCSRLIS